MSKKRTMQIDVIEEVKGTQFMQCKLYIDGNASVILMNKIDYERLLSDSFFVRDGKNRDSAGVLNTTNTFLEKIKYNVDNQKEIIKKHNETLEIISEDTNKANHRIAKINRNIKKIT
jgi:hypothetical protein